MSNRDNLININDRPANEAKAIRSKGGKARAKKARDRATMREIIEYSLVVPYFHMYDNNDSREFHTISAETDYYHELAYQIMSRALRDPKYTKLLLQIIGDLPDKNAPNDAGAEVVNIEWDE